MGQSRHPHPLPRHRRTGRPAMGSRVRRLPPYHAPCGSAADRVAFQLDQRENRHSASLEGAFLPRFARICIRSARCRNAPPRSQTLIRIRYTNPAITERKALQKESSPTAAGFSYFGPVWLHNVPGSVLTLCHALRQFQTRDTFRSLRRWGCRVARSESAGRFHATHLCATRRRTVRADLPPPHWRS